MIASLRMFYTSVGRKLVMAMTGLFLCLFLLEHLYTNLLLYKMDTGVAYEEFAAFLKGNLIIRIIEFVLFGSIILHAVDAFFLTRKNASARPVKYAMSHQAENSTWFSRNMGLTGSIILIFLIIHLKTFFVQHRFLGAENRMAVDVASAFQSPLYAALYVVAMILLGAHLNHGFQSAIHTMGWSNHKYRPALKTASTLFALIMMLGFASFPIMFYFDIFGVSSNILNH